MIFCLPFLLDALQFNCGFWLLYRRVCDGTVISRKAGEGCNMTTVHVAHSLTLTYKEAKASLLKAGIDLATIIPTRAGKPLARGWTVRATSTLGHELRIRSGMDGRFTIQVDRVKTRHSPKRASRKHGKCISVAIPEAGVLT